MMGGMIPGWAGEWERLAAATLPGSPCQTATVKGHRLVVQHPALPDHLEVARVIVLWETPSVAGRRLPPPGLAGMGVEKGDILSGPPDEEWETLSRC